MGKYPTYRSDPYVDQTSGILRNVLGITDQAELDRAEAALVALRTNELSFRQLEGKFDLAHLRAIHRHLFSDVYAWAGDVRTVDITKGTTRFASHEQINRKLRSPDHAAPGRRGVPAKPRSSGI